MAITFTRYINIISSVGGQGEVPTQQLITRIFTASPLLPPQSFIEFTNIEEVSAYFGSTGEEYARAAAYLAWINKQGNSPPAISFARWVATACAPVAYSDPTEVASLTAFQAITAGELQISIGSASTTLTGLNFSTAVSLGSASPSVASILQAALVAISGFSGTTVGYSTVTGQFVIQGATAGTAAGKIAFTSGSQNTVATALGMLSPNAILAEGSDVESITTTLANTVNASTNFASVAFLTESNPLTLTQYEQAAQYIAGQNNEYVLLVPVSSANAAAWSAALLGYEGTALTLTASTTDFAEMLPGKIMAATNYSNVNASQNFMFQQDSSLIPTVTTDAAANTYDALRINYYGQTQVNGQFINFYQRGYMCGGNTAPTDMTAFTNEIWFKGDVEQNIANLLLSVSNVPANNSGRVLLMANLQASINDALNNGVISTGNALTITQKQYIQSITGDSTVAAQIATIGYWVNLTFSSYLDDSGATEWQANYQIIYATSKGIRSVTGTHNLI